MVWGKRLILEALKKLKTSYLKTAWILTFASIFSADFCIKANRKTSELYNQTVSRKNFGVIILKVNPKNKFELVGSI